MKQRPLIFDFDPPPPTVTFYPSISRLVWKNQRHCSHLESPTPGILHGSFFWIYYYYYLSSYSCDLLDKGLGVFNTFFCLLFEEKFGPFLSDKRGIDSWSGMTAKAGATGDQSSATGLANNGSLTDFQNPKEPSWKLAGSNAWGTPMTFPGSTRLIIYSIFGEMR